MKRDLFNKLLEWKTHPLRKPLILRGARQVGKSWLVQELGKTFRSFVEINFEKEKDVASLFKDNIKMAELLERLSIYKGKKIVPGETLLFLDEIQGSENALKTLRYFKEDLPELHVVAAGSLVGFALEEISMPVGRVQFMYLYPLSFGEFLTALGRDDLRQYIRSQKVEPVIHEQLLDLLKNYMWLGGLPAVVASWLEFKDPELVKEAQDEIVQAYRQDFSKYARSRQIPHVAKVFDSIPVQLGNKFKYSHVDSETKVQPIKNALELLEKADIAIPAYHTSGHGVPLGAEKDEKKFKVFFFDIGLAQRILGLDLKEWILSDLKVVNIGAIAEQFVAQEFLAYSPPKIKTELFYWQRESPSSNAEVDLLAVKDNMVVPVEVKSGIKGGMKSMQMFLNTHPNSKYGLKISEGNFSSHGNIKEVPFYGIEAWWLSSDSLELNSFTGL